MLPKDEVDAARAGPDPGPALLRLWVRREALFKAGFEGGFGGGFEAGRDDVRLTAWTDHRRAAVVALAGADGALAPSLSSGPAPLPFSSGPAPPSGR